jgi:hypothetical protein
MHPPKLLKFNKGEEYMSKEQKKRFWKNLEGEEQEFPPGEGRLVVGSEMCMMGQLEVSRRLDSSLERQEMPLSQRMEHFVASIFHKHDHDLGVMEDVVLGELVRKWVSQSPLPFLSPSLTKVFILSPLLVASASCSVFFTRLPRSTTASN